MPLGCNSAMHDELFNSDIISTLNLLLYCLSEEFELKYFTGKFFKIVTYGWFDAFAC